MNASLRISKLLLESGAVLLRPSEPFTFASGIRSPIYCDNRILLSGPKTRKAVVDAFVEMLEPDQIEQVLGVATAGIAWGAWIADKLKAQYGYVRNAAKEHGRQNRIEGDVQKNLPSALVEDLVSTGGSVLSALQVLREQSVNVVGIYAIFSYGFKEAEAAFKNESCSLHSIVQFEDLLKVAQELKKITVKEADSVRLWQQNPRSWG